MNDELSSARPGRRRRATAMILIVAVAGGLIGVFATQSFSQGFGPPWHRIWGPTWHMTVRGPMDGPFGGPLTPQQMADRADRMVRHLAIELDASPDQTAKLETIVKGAVADLAPMRDKMLATRQQVHDLLLATTIDRGAIEKLRADQVATVDALSKRVAQAVGDAAEVLTPDQRHKLGDMLPPHDGPGGGYWHPWFRG